MRSGDVVGASRPTIVPSTARAGGESTPDLSVVIVSFNTRDQLAACLRSLRARSREIALEVIVVDNGSADGSAELVRRGTEFPGAVLVANGRNLGYAAACNI